MLLYSPQIVGKFVHMLIFCTGSGTHNFHIGERRQTGVGANVGPEGLMNWLTGVLPLGGVSTRCCDGAAAAVAAVGFWWAARGGIRLTGSTVGR